MIGGVATALRVFFATAGAYAKRSKLLGAGHLPTDRAPSCQHLFWEWFIEPRILTAILLIVSAAALYAACIGAMRAVVTRRESAPSARAGCQFLPIGATAISAMLMHHPEVALAVIFGTSVAFLSLVLGMATYVAPMNPAEPRPKVWAFLLGPVLLTLIAGFTGNLSGLNAAMLMLLGAPILALWHEDSKAGTLTALAEDRSSPRRQSDWTRWIQLVVAIGLAGVAGTAAVAGASSAAQLAHIPGETLVGLSILSPMLVLPALRVALTVAERGDPRGAVSSIVGTVLLNFCLLLPVIVLLWYYRSGNSLNIFSFFQSLPADNSVPVQVMTFPGGLWRLENVALVILGFAMLPVALGRITLARLESGLLVLGYALYLGAVALSAKHG